MSQRNGGGAIRVVVAATSAVRRAGLEAIIRDQPDFQLAASTGAVARIALYVAQHAADVVIADSDSIPALTEPPPPPIVLLTETPEARAISRWLKGGVRAILPRESDSEDIVSAIYAAYSGHVLLSAEAAEKLAAIYGEQELEPGDIPVEGITSREAEVLRMLAEGLANKDIARRLGISEHTVKFHISSILEKLGASTRTEAVTLGIRRGIIPI
jgi:two-component system, NarL family, response regulator YdfI